MRNAKSTTALERRASSSALNHRAKLQKMLGKAIRGGAAECFPSFEGGLELASVVF
jgi:hypothetical protein